MDDCNRTHHRSHDNCEALWRWDLSYGMSLLDMNGLRICHAYSLQVHRFMSSEYERLWGLNCLVTSIGKHINHPKNTQLPCGRCICKAKFRHLKMQNAALKAKATSDLFPLFHLFRLLRPQDMFQWDQVDLQLTYFNSTFHPITG